MMRAREGRRGEEEEQPERGCNPMRIEAVLARRQFFDVRKERET